MYCRRLIYKKDNPIQFEVNHTPPKWESDRALSKVKFLWVLWSMLNQGFLPFNLCSTLT
jgi:hypothetical protein